jgi:hypothetical protein
MFTINTFNPVHFVNCTFNEQTKKFEKHKEYTLLHKRKLPDSEETVNEKTNLLSREHFCSNDGIPQTTIYPHKRAKIARIEELGYKKLVDMGGEDIANQIYVSCNRVQKPRKKRINFESKSRSESNTLQKTRDFGIKNMQAFPREEASIRIFGQFSQKIILPLPLSYKVKPSYEKNDRMNLSFLLNPMY